MCKLSRSVILRQCYEISVIVPYGRGFVTAMCRQSGCLGTCPQTVNLQTFGVWLRQQGHCIGPRDNANLVEPAGVQVLEPHAI